MEEEEREEGAPLDLIGEWAATAGADEPASTPERERVDEREKPKRVTAIDALRGFDMFWIIGGREVLLAVAAIFATPVPAALEYHLDHPPWVGFSAWDLIMPLFLFIVGAAMPFSIGRRVEAGEPLGRIYRKIITRTLVLFVFGMVAQGNLLEFRLETLHIYCNTLQAIAVGYLVSSVLLLHAGLRVQIAVTAMLLLVYWGTLALIPVGESGMGTLDPEANVALLVDKAILGPYEDGTTYTWILSSLGFAATVMMGVFGGRVLKSPMREFAKPLALVALGGACLAGGALWSLSLPIVKHIWTSSMVLWSAGWCYFLLAVFYLFLDVPRVRSRVARWLASPFIVIGMNAIFVYMATHVIDFGAISRPLVGGIARHLGENLGDPYAVALLEVAKLAVIWLILLHMYRRRIFLRV